ncbi:MAG: hypothetical protein COW18_08775 [Zetaproteobacteria bacterium CG12_big_fil_rev_8_21_14_0_65_54_13]|nr:MAG: hypothetical protein COX55_00520 [Zetaproteobacteria bacterium CG23_combo_of_CG06-09_8_20_14_all_54_7]PIW47551.1 MAG: hypothetical protein COW18_08775 [Zetaproteobacteria bacterium CG12_big_fil_rev_8_21_14_0_65_54_13]
MAPASESAQMSVMQAAWTDLIALMHAWGLWLAIGSVAIFIIGLISMPFIVARIPVDYFIHDRRQHIKGDRRHPVIEMAIVVLKNILGSILLLTGFIMLFTPGPGLICMLVGLMIINYPGKYRLERWLIHRPLILQAVNAMRKKRSQPPLLSPETLHDPR